MANEPLSLLKTFQTLVVGGVGFTGVIATLFWNAWFDRRKQERQRRHERNALRTALKTELLLNKQIYEQRLEQLQQGTHGRRYVLIPNKVYDEVYRMMLGTVGIIAEEEVKRILTAYGLMGELPYRLRRLAGIGDSGHINDEFTPIQEGQLAEACAIHEAFLSEIGMAIQSIDRHLGQ